MAHIGPQRLRGGVNDNNRYVGQIAPSLSADNFNAYAKGVSSGAIAPINGENIDQAFEYANEGQKARDEDNKKQSLFIQAVSQANADAAVRGMPTRNLYQEQGYAGLQNPAQFKKATILPFDEEGASGRNYQGIVNSYDPKVFATSEGLLNQVKSMAPMAQTTIGYHGSLYGGVSQNYAVNRLYIFNTRNREENMYAFI